MILNKESISGVSVTEIRLIAQNQKEISITNTMVREIEEDEAKLVISFCDNFSFTQEIKLINSRCIKMELYISGKKYLVKPMMLFEAEFPESDFAFVTDKDGLIKTSANQLVLYKHPG